MINSNIKSASSYKLIGKNEFNTNIYIIYKPLIFKTVEGTNADFVLFYLNILD